jgi:uroporphyrin-III C-methyltransferase
MKNTEQNKTHIRKKISEPEFTFINYSMTEPDQITVSAANALSSADVIVYDELVNEELLKYVPYDSPKFLIKKKTRNPKYVNEQIQQLLSDLAFTYGHVVYVQGISKVFNPEIESILQYLDGFNIKINQLNYNPYILHYSLN